MLEIFYKGGPIMWPLLITSICTVAVLMERLWFFLTSGTGRDSETIEKLLSLVERGVLDDAIAKGEPSPDVASRVIAHGLKHLEHSFEGAVLVASEKEIARYTRGLSVLDTVITLSPLLGLLGTVTGMINSFGLLGQQELGAPTQITGGIAEALIATAFGLSIAIIALVPFNFLNARVETLRRTIEEAVTRVEILLEQRRKTFQ